MGGRVRSAERDTGNGARVLVGKNRTCPGLTVDLKAVVVNRLHFPGEGSEVVPVKLRLARDSEHFLQQAVGVNRRSGSSTRFRKIDCDRLRVARRGRLGAGHAIDGGGKLPDAMERLLLLHRIRGSFDRLRVQAEDTEKSEG